MVRGKTKGSLAARLDEILRGRGRRDRVARGPTSMALEQLYSHYKHPRTAILMGHARGVICLAAAKAGIEVMHYSATQIKTDPDRRRPGARRARCRSAIRSELQPGPSRPTRPTWPTRWPWPCVTTILKVRRERLKQKPA